MRDGWQVGWAQLGNIAQAALWNGSADSFVSLRPTGASSSIAYDLHAGRQVGVAEIGGRDRASLWSGSAASWIDLSPVGSGDSEAYGIYGEEQVGFAVVHGQRRASLWRGSADSWTDLTPTGALGSVAWSVHLGMQAGSAAVDSQGRASVWSGTADSWEDLSLALTGAWGNTVARGIWVDDTTIYVGGYGQNLTTQRVEALLWTRPIPSPSAVVLGVLWICVAGRRRAQRDGR